MARKIRKPQKKAKYLMQNDEARRNDQSKKEFKGTNTINNSLASLKRRKQKKIAPKAKKGRRRLKNKLINFRKKSKSSKTGKNGEKIKAADKKVKTYQPSKPNNGSLIRTVLKSSIKDGYQEEFRHRSTGDRLYRDEYGRIEYNGCWYKTGEEFLETRDTSNPKPKICKSKAEVVGDHKKPDEARFINEYGDLVVKQPGGLVHVSGQPYEYGYGQYLNQKRTNWDLEEQKKRIRMNGGNPDKFTFAQICVKEEHGLCYHEGPKHCVKWDWAKKCLRWYFFPQRYDDSGKLVKLGRMWETAMETPYEFEKKLHYKSGHDKICVLGRVRRIPGKPNTRNRCVSFPKMFDSYPHLAKQLQAEFPKALPKNHQASWINYENRYRNGRYIKMNEKSFKGIEDALSIIEKMINGADDPKCEWIGDVLPFLQPYFKEFIEECTM